MPWKVLVGLILCNLIWSAHPAMGKIVMNDVSPALGAWLRYSSALAAYVACIGIFLPVRRARGGGPRSSSDSFFLIPRNTRDWLLVSAVGFMAFCFAPLLQMTGLDTSRATDNALIVSMEPLITVVLARVFLRERLALGHWVAFAMALVGFSLLTGLSLSGVMNFRGSGGHILGNLLMLTALIGEASYSVLGRKLVDRHPPIGVFGTALLIGVVFLTLFTTMIGGVHVFSGVAQVSWKSVIAILWLGPLGTALAYLYWMIVLREAPVASLALTLFIQPVFGSLWGFEFLHERLSEPQAVGAALIVFALLIQAPVSRWQTARESYGASKL